MIARFALLNRCNLQVHILQERSRFVLRMATAFKEALEDLLQEVEPLWVALVLSSRCGSP